MDRGSGERQKKHLEEKTVARGIAYESSRSAAEFGRLLAWALCVACFFLLLYVGTEQGAEAALQKWPYLALTALAAGMTAVSSGETQKVLEFLSQELDCRKSR